MLPLYFLYRNPLFFLNRESRSLATGAPQVAWRSLWTGKSLQMISPEQNKKNSGIPPSPADYFGAFSTSGNTTTAIRAASMR